MSQQKNSKREQDEFLSQERLSYLRTGYQPLLISQRRITISQQRIRAYQLVLDAFHLRQEVKALLVEIQWNYCMAAELNNEVPAEKYALQVLNDQSKYYQREAHRLGCRAQQLLEEAAHIQATLR